MKKNQKNPDRKKKLFVEYLSNPDSTEAPEKFASRIGVPLEQLNIWKSDSSVVHAVFHKCLTINKAEIPKLLKMLLNRALKEEDIPACKLFLQQLEKNAGSQDEGMTIDDALSVIDKAVKKIKTDDTGPDKNGERNEAG